MEKVIAKKRLTDAEAEKLVATYVTEDHFDGPPISESCDVYDSAGKLLAKFRKGALPLDVLESGVNAFWKSIGQSHNRGNSAGGYYFETKTDGTQSKARMSATVESGIVGALEGGGLNPFCRLTAFTANYFEQYRAGIPFVEAIDRLYSELAPEHYKIQREYAKATNKNYIIGNTAFSTVTVNRNFRTAVHQDAGDLPQGFGNLIAYRKGDWTGGYFCLPQYRIAFDLKNTDVLFVDVHKHHGNTPCLHAGQEITDWPENLLRVSFVLYYREEIIKCRAPKDELARMKKLNFGFNKL